jgi:hypothetical protein
MTKSEILIEALKARKDEILGYQINIDNYRLAMEKIAHEHTGATPLDAAMREFGQHLDGLLQSSLIEQRKAQIIHDVIELQLEV